MRAGARLPAFDEARPLGPDLDGDPRTGNVLLLVREADAVEVVVNPATGQRRRIDTYRVACVYPGVTTRNLVAGGALAVDLVHWRSEAWPAHAQLLAISGAAERTAAVQALVDQYGFDRAWDPTLPVESSFFALAADGSIAATPEPDPSIPEDPEVSPGGLLVSAGLQLAPTDAASVPRRAVFDVDPPETWSPHGFEVKVAGASGARRVWLHVVLEAVKRGALAVEAHTAVASTRDL
jgi:hypothetical protein